VAEYQINKEPQGAGRFGEEAARRPFSLALSAPGDQQLLSIEYCASFVGNACDAGVDKLLPALILKFSIN
jgi:hypothetical protein